MKYSNKLFSTSWIGWVLKWIHYERYWDVGQ